MRIRSERAYSYASKVTNTLIKKGLKDFSKSDSMGAVIGALSGTALGFLAVKLTSTKLVRDIAKSKKDLDDTYSPMQRLLSEEIELLNSKIVKSRLVAKSLGNIAGSLTFKLTSNSSANEMIGATIGTYLSGVLVDAFTKKSRLRLEELLAEYIPTLTKEQILLRNKLDENTRKMGTRWTLGIVGGVLLGGYLGKATSEAYKEYKEDKINKINK
jgi:hypothetical protein